MADIRLAKPVAGTTQTVPSAPDGRFIFDFPADAATLTRNGDDLVLSFEDGSSIQLQGFYTTYSKEEMPSFQVEGVEISGEDFFAALGEDLMPAAGPANANNASRDGRYNEYGNSDLLDGIDHLGRLDIGFDGGVELAEDEVGGWTHQNLDPEISGIIAVDGNDMTLVESGVETDENQKIQGNVFTPGVPVIVGQVVASDPDGGRLSYSFADGSNRIVTEYGVITIDADTGVITYELSNDDTDTDSLPLGETVRQDFTVRVEDGQGGKAEASFSVTIKGTNDQPEVRLDEKNSELELTESGVGRTNNGQVVPDSGTMAENQEYDGSHPYGDTQQLKGSVIGLDVDAGNKLWFGVVAGDQRKEGNEGWEGATPPATDDFLADESTVEGGDSKTVPGTFGSLTLNSDGTWTYTLKGEQVELPEDTKITLDGELISIKYIDELPEGAEVEDTFTIYVKDENGAWNLETVTITITGTNDQPTLEFKEQSGTLYESGVGRDPGTNVPVTDPTDPADENAEYAGVNTTTGTIKASDIDLGDNLYFAVSAGSEATEVPQGNLTTDEQKTVTATGKYGILKVEETANGEATYTYTLNADNVAITFPVTIGETTYNDLEALKAALPFEGDQLTLNNLPEGAEVKDTFTIFVQDDKGAWVSKDVTITITGTNDQPTVELVDGSQLELTESGVGRIDSDNVVENPGTEAENAEYNGSKQLEGKVTGHDVDAGDKLWFGVVAGDQSKDGSWEGATAPTESDFLKQASTAGGTPAHKSVEGTFGSLTLNSDGTWTYALKGEQEKLPEGTKITLDGDPISITYIDELPEGATATDTFTIYVKDEHGAWNLETVTITITGTNDQPTLEFKEQSGTLYESGVGRDPGTNVPVTDPTDPADENAEYAGVNTTTGTIKASDIDLGDNLYFAVSAGSEATEVPQGNLTTDEQKTVTATGKYGILKVEETANGEATYTYTLKDGGDTIPLIFPVTIGEMTYADLEALKAGLGWNFDGDQLTLNNLPEGAEVKDTFTIFVQDDKGAWQKQEVEFTIKGTNDQPVITAHESYDYIDGDRSDLVPDTGDTWDIAAAEQGVVEEGNKPSDYSDIINGQFHASDVDAGAQLTFSATLAGATLSDGLDGKGVSIENQPGTVLDGYTGETKHISEITADFNDADGGDKFSIPAGEYQVFELNVGDFYLAADGHYYFDVDDSDPLVHGMNQGEKITLTFTLTVKDDKGAYAEKEFTVTINGTNDKPELTLKDAVPDENGNFSVSINDVQAYNGVPGPVEGTFGRDDPDYNDSHTFRVVQSESPVGGGDPNQFGSYKPVDMEDGGIQTVVAGRYGTLVLNADGTYTYTLYGPDDTDPAHKAAYEEIKNLKEGEELEEPDSFHVAVQDKNGAFDIETITFPVTGTDNTPSVSSDTVYVKEEGVYAAGSGEDETFNNATSNAAESNEITDPSQHRHEVSGQLEIKDWEDGSGTEDDKLSFDLEDLTFKVSGKGPGNSTLSETVDAELIPGEDGNSCTYITAYGTLIMHADGHYTFKLQADAVNYLAKDEDLTLSITVPGMDSADNVAHGTITVVVQGSNDMPTLTVENKLYAGDRFGGDTPVMDNDPSDGISFTVQEKGSDGEGSDVYTGKVEGADADNGAQLSYGVVRGEHGTNENDSSDLNARHEAFGEGGKTAEGTYGTLFINKNGTYTYKLNDTANDLAEGEHGEDTFTIYVKDENGAWTAQQVSFTVQGNNDLALVDAGSHTITVNAGELVYGTNTELSSADRQPVYDNSEAPHGTIEVQWKEGSSETQRFGFAVDGKRLEPNEDGTYTLRSEDGTEYGTLELTPSVDGSSATYTFTLNDTWANTLNPNQKVNISDVLGGLEVIAYDSRYLEEGGTFEYSGQQLNIYVTGNNNRPTMEIRGDQIVNLGENSLSASGKLVGEDIDPSHNTGNVLRYGFVDESGTVKAGQVQADAKGYGILQLDPVTGKYTYTVTHPEMLAGLADGKTTTVSFDVVVRDPLKGTSEVKELTFTLTGKQDDAVIKPVTGTVTEFDTEPGDRVGGKPDFCGGTLELNTGQADGFWGDAQKYGEVEWKLIGVPTGGGSVSSGMDGKGVYTKYEGTYGILTVYEDGSYIYQLHTGAQELAEGQVVYEKFTVSATVKDGAGTEYTVERDITMQVTGTNDAPTIDPTHGTGDNAIRVTRNDFITPNGMAVSGEANGNDIDTLDKPGLIYKLVDQDGNLVTDMTTEYGSISIDPVTGKYTYILNNESEAVSNMLEGEIGTDSFKVWVTDPHGGTAKKTIEVVITGNPDEGGGGKVPEHANITIKGVREDHTWSVTEDAYVPVSDDKIWVPGTDGSGGEEVDASDEGNSVSEGLDSSRVTSKPGQIENDDKSRYGASTEPNGEQSQIVRGKYGYLTIDPATGEYFYTLYNDNPDVQELKAGSAPLEETFYLMWKGDVVKNPDSDDPCTITVEIKGTNDAPIIKTEDTRLTVAETEDGDGEYPSAKGTLTLEDVDKGDTPVLTDAEGNAYKSGDSFETEKGKVTLSYDEATEEWTYTYTCKEGTDLKAGQTETDSFYLYVRDEGGLMTRKEFEVTIKGENNAPEVNERPPLEAVEDGLSEEGTSSVAGKLVGTDGLFSDDEEDKNLSFTVSGEADSKGEIWADGEYGRLFIDLSDPNNPVYRYYLNNSAENVQELHAGEKVKDTFWITATDKHGESTKVAITVNITGTDDAPQFSVGDTILVKEGQTNDTDGNFSITQKIETIIIDKDDKGTEGDPGYSFSFKQGDTGEDPVTTLETDYGTFTINDDGTFTFTLDNDADAVKALKQGEIRDITQTIYLKDASGQYHEQTIHVSITGTNTAPELEVMTDAVDEGGTTSIEIKATDHDADDGDKMTYRFADLTADEIAKGWELSGGGKTLTTQYGKAVIGADGTITYTANNADSLSQGQTVSETFRVQASDKFGAVSDPGEVTVTITGTNDAPALVVEQSGGILSGTVTITDVDASDTHDVTFNGLYGKDAGTGEVTPLSVENVEGLKGTEGTTLAVYNAEGEKIGELTLTYTGGTGDSDTLTYTFTPDEEYLNSLEVGIPKDIGFGITVSDKNGGTDAQDGLQFTVTNKNDNPEITAVQQPDGNNEGSLTFSDDDKLDTQHSVTFEGLYAGAGGDTPLTVDNVESLVEGKDFSVYNKDGLQIGTLTLRYEDGELTYTLSTENFENNLPVGDSTIDFTITVSDKSGDTDTTDGNLQFTVTNDNDAPVIDEDLSQDPAAGNTGTLVFTDADVKDTHSVSFEGLTTGDGEALKVDLDSLTEGGKTVDVYQGTQKVGMLELQYAKVPGEGAGGTGMEHTLTYTFTPDDDYLATLPRGEGNQVEFALTVNDGDVDSGKVTVTIPVESTNEAPKIGTEGIPETDGSNTGTVTITDSDTGESLAVCIKGAEGTLVIITADGEPVTVDGVSYTYTDGTLRYEVLPERTEGMEPGKEDMLQVTVVVDDGHGKVEQPVSLPVTSTAPTEGGEGETEGETFIVPDGENQAVLRAQSERQRLAAEEAGLLTAAASFVAGITPEPADPETFLQDTVPAQENGPEALVAEEVPLPQDETVLQEEMTDLPDADVPVSETPLADDLLAEPLLFAGLESTEGMPEPVETLRPETADDTLLAEETDPVTAATPPAFSGEEAGDGGLLLPEGVEGLFGTDGDDYLRGGEGSDAIFGGAGNDIIVYDQQDYLVSGGSGIDFMVSDDTSLTLDGLLSNTSSDKPLVSGIEVLLKGEDALSLTSINDLADRYGITLGVNEAGEETLQLDDRWTKQDDGSYDFNGGAEADGGLTLETSLTPVETGDPASEAVQQQVFTLEHSNG